MQRKLIAALAGVAALGAVAPAFAQGYGQNYSAPPPPAQPGYQPDYNNGSPPPPPPGQPGYDQGRYGHGDFWRGAPQGPWERVQWLQSRIDRGRADGSINPREAFRAQRQLDSVKRYVRNARARYGQLRPEDRDYVMQNLDNLSQRIRWDRHNGY